MRNSSNVLAWRFHMPKTPSLEQVQVNFRMPVELRDQLRSASEGNHRSLNAEIVARLEQSFWVDTAAALEWTQLPEGNALRAKIEMLDREHRRFMEEMRVKLAAMPPLNEN
jgi:hypothetical protein